MKNLIISILCLFILAACQPKTKANVRPAWIQNPGKGAVGSCPTHLMGRHEQEELAISLARTRLAATLGVTVGQIQTIRTTANNTSSNVSLESKTVQTMKGNTVKAHVKAIWYDKPKDTIWAWLYPVQ